MTLKLSNLSKPSNPKWKLVADILLYTLPAYSLAMAASPLPEAFKLWANFVIGTTVITIKAISKFTSDEPIEETNE